MDSVKKQVIRRMAMDKFAKVEDPVLMATSMLPPTPNCVDSQPACTIPDSLMSGYTQGGKIAIRYCHFDDSVPAGEALNISQEMYKMYYEMFDRQKFPYYGYEGYTFFEAIEKYPLKDKKVIIYGLASCNCDAFALWSGARHLHIVEYNPVVCEHERVSIYTPSQFSQVDIGADCAISYSSFEHDGLGRYGDPLNPDGDLEAMEGCRRSLKKGGHLFLGIPLGQDCVVFNAHRIYGRNRLPLLLKGYKLCDVFSCYGATSPEFPFLEQVGEYRYQMLLVLQKIDTDWADDDYLISGFQPVNNQHSFCNKEVALQINRFIYNYKHGIVG